jgi:hypothetical protein
MTELQEMARSCTQERERRLLWEVSRIRAILRRADELEVMVRDEHKTLLLDKQLERVANALRADLEKEPAIIEDRERHQAKRFEQASRGKNPAWTRADLREVVFHEGNEGRKR